MQCYYHILYSVSGRIYGPYGGNGGRYFEAIPPKPYNKEGRKMQCFLGWISGQSDQRLDGISFHWKCPKEPSHTYVENEPSYTFVRQISQSPIYKSDTSKLYFSHIILCSIFISLLYSVNINICVNLSNHTRTMMKINR